MVVGAGLAGLVAALRLARAGRRVTVMSRGVGGLPLSSGTVEVLGYAPGRVASPAQALPAFAAASPGHPYGILGPVLAEALGWFSAETPGMGWAGGLERNVLLPTALGVPRPRALVPATMAAGDVAGGGSLLIAGFRAMRDFHPALVAANLERAGIDGLSARPAWVVQTPRPDAADAGATNLARAMDDPAFRRAVAGDLAPHLRPGDRVGMPAIIGMERAGEAHADLEALLGAPVFEIPTVPPSVPGLRLHAALTAAIRGAGGRLVTGPEAVGAEWADGRITGVVVREPGRDRVHPVDACVLATGGFAAGGLELDSHGVVSETVLGLPVHAPPPGEGLSPGYLDPQPLLAAGLRVDARMRPLGADGAPVHVNLHAAGDLVAGALPWREASGEGLSIAGGYAAAGAILEATR
jgi:glycerol-3-phosphate dehydrogenase subunit B